MCGIAAIFAYRENAPVVDQQELLSIREAMITRGPDGAGLWTSDDRCIGLAHRRLAIIDVAETGAQPMATADGTMRVVFNGEIYNYRELRGQLEAKGYEFRSRSDTEVLLHLYREYGADLVKELRGMYAFAIYDSRNRGLLLARDPYGIKPLYFADDGQTIRAASQVKALLKSKTIDTGVEPAGHVGFYLWGYVPEPFTLYRGIQALTPGTTLWIDVRGRKQARRMFDVTDELAKACHAPANVTQAEGRERLRTALLDSVRHHLVADVPVGVFLSAGIDSCTLTALIREVGGPQLRTITLGFTEFQGTINDEVPFAEEIAKQYGTQHHTAWITKADFERHRHAFLDAMDQPSIDGLNTYFVSKAAADAGLKVAISGLGGDELCGGYPSFRQIPRLVNGLSPLQGLPALGKGFRYLSAPILKHFTSPKYAGLFEYGGTCAGAYLLRRGMFMPWELPGLLDEEMVRIGWNDLRTLSHLQSSVEGIHTSHLRVSALESTWYLRNQLLRDTDWASMAHAVEVRTPLVDWALVRRVASLHATPSCLSKAGLAQSPSQSLPAAVLTRGKTGFTVPVREWLLEAMGSQERGLRGWAKAVYQKQSNAKRAMVFITDAYGGFGGIAKFNRDFLGSFAEQEQFREVVALPRIMSEVTSEPLPNKVRYLSGAANGKFHYVTTLFSLLLSHQRFDVVVCGHLYLLPLAWFASRLLHTPLVLIIHGIEAWKPTSSLVVNRLVGKIDCLISVSAVTRDRFASWASIFRKPTFILPNTVDVEQFQPRPKRQELIDRHQLQDKKVIMTLGRLDSREAYKGIDEVLEVLPRLLEAMPNLIYLIVGSGSDVPRLEHKVEGLGLVQHVVFAGAIPEVEKVDYYNLADAFVMPGRGEGFGIVYLEALACGVPVVGSILDGSKEALLDGKLGHLVNPNDPGSIQDGITQALARTRNAAIDLGMFSRSHFQGCVHKILHGI